MHRRLKRALSDELDTTPIVEMDLFRIDAPRNLVKLTAIRQPTCTIYPNWCFATAKDWFFPYGAPDRRPIYTILSLAHFSFHSAYSTQSAETTNVPRRSAVGSSRVNLNPAIELGCFAQQPEPRIYRQRLSDCRAKYRLRARTANDAKHRLPPIPRRYSLPPKRHPDADRNHRWHSISPQAETQPPYTCPADHRPSPSGISPT